MRTFYVRVEHIVKVELDETKFTADFMAQFASTISDFDTLEQHAEHIAQLAAREVYGLSRHVPSEFVEGYGPIGLMGISAEVRNTEVEEDTQALARWVS